MTEFAKYQVMAQSGVAMLAQANQLPQQILALMKG
jgi:flagellin-like hook-associated protein FlgL